METGAAGTGAGALLTKVTAPKTALASLSVTTLDLRYLDLVAEHP